MRTLNLFLLFFFLFALNSYSLPKCEGVYSKKTWNNCIGTTILKDKKWPQGREYIGEFRHGEPNGHGTATWPEEPDKNKYVGQWKNGLRHGRGIQSVLEYSFEALWIKDSMEGKGIMHWPSSNPYNIKKIKGTLSNYGFKGKAELTYFDGTNINLEYDSNSLVTRAGVWYSEKSEDEFEGTSQIYFFSNKLPPNKPLSSPYKNSDPVLGIVCEKRGEKDKCWIFLKFKALNVLRGKIEEGNSLYKVRVKLESGKIETLYATVRHGGNALFFSNDLKMNTFLRENKKLLIEINHYADGKRHYKIETSGFAEIMDNNFPNNYYLDGYN